LPQVRGGQPQIRIERPRPHDHTWVEQVVRVEHGLRRGERL
jgi:hypothetical protein